MNSNLRRIGDRRMLLSSAFALGLTGYQHIDDESVVIVAETYEQETPSPYSLQRLVGLVNSTGSILESSDAHQTVATAFEFMKRMSERLEYSELADEQADTVARRLLANCESRKIGG